MRKLTLGSISLWIFISMTCGGGAEGMPRPVSLTTLMVEAPRAPQPVGMRQQLTAIATFSDHTTRDVTSCASWTSDETKVVMVTPSGGREMALSPGDATVSATFSAYGKTATASVPVRVTPATVWPKTVESEILQRELFMTSQESDNRRTLSRKASATGKRTSRTRARRALSVADTHLDTVCAASTITAPHSATMHTGK